MWVRRTRCYSAFMQLIHLPGSISTADGSALVRLGDTTIVCGVKAEIAEPDLNSPSAGFLVPNLDLPAICSPKFKPGPPSEEAQVLSEKLNDILTLYVRVSHSEQSLYRSQFWPLAARVAMHTSREILLGALR